MQKIIKYSLVYPYLWVDPEKCEAPTLLDYIFAKSMKFRVFVYISNKALHALQTLPKQEWVTCGSGVIFPNSLHSQDSNVFITPTVCTQLAWCYN